MHALNALLAQLKCGLSYTELPVYIDVLSETLKALYALKFDYEWVKKVNGDVPHFWDNGLLNTALNDGRGLTRAFYAMELLRSQHRVLDIGCGDGFIANKFLAPSCAWLDGVDVLPEAIAASNKNKAKNAAYTLCDAIRDAFPHPYYDRILLDGAIGHFSRTDSLALLRKVADSLTDDGIFSGSESLGMEGEDHMQFFMSPGELAALLKEHFSFVTYRTLSYPLSNNFIRQEIYWRCTNSRKTLQQTYWKQYV